MSDNTATGVYDPRPPTPVEMPTVKLLAPDKGEPYPLVDGAVLEPDEAGIVEVPCNAVLTLLKAGFTFVAASATLTQAANVSNSTEEVSPTVAEFNALLKALKDAGLMAADAPS